MEEPKYAEDILVGSTYFGSPVTSITSYTPENTYLYVYEFTLQDGSIKRLFYDQELS